jgi:hypothetical protein
LKKYTLKEDLALRKADMILEIGHDMLWGKDLQALCKANIAMTKDLMAKFSSYGSSIRLISLIFWAGNEICGEHGVEPLPIWGRIHRAIGMQSWTGSRGTLFGGISS